MLVSTGATEFDANYKSKPYTLGWQPDYFAEGAIYGKYAVQNWPTKKIGVIYQNDDYGKNYLEGLKSGLGSKASNIVTTQGFAVTDTSVAQQVVAIRQSGADVIAILATPAPTVRRLRDDEGAEVPARGSDHELRFGDRHDHGARTRQRRRGDDQRDDQHLVSDGLLTIRSTRTRPG